MIKVATRPGHAPRGHQARAGHPGDARRRRTSRPWCATPASTARWSTPRWPTFGIVADADLGLMHPDQTLGELTGPRRPRHRRLAGQRAGPTWCWCRATPPPCSARRSPPSTASVPVGHVEAGLRTWTRSAPFPEEINRVLTTRLADWHFAPTEGARAEPAARRRAGRRHRRDRQHGDRRLLLARERLRRAGRDRRHRTATVDAELAGRPDPALVLITGHRRENFGAGFAAICAAIARAGPVVPRRAVRLSRPPESPRPGAGAPRAWRAWRTSASCRPSPTCPSSP